MFLLLGYYKYSCYKDSCKSFCKDKCYHSSWAKTYQNSWIIGQVLCLALKKMPKCFPKWLYYFTVPTSMYDCSFISISLPMILILESVKYLILVSICISWMVYDFEQLFTYLLNVHVSVLLKYQANIFCSFCEQIICPCKCFVYAG